MLRRALILGVCCFFARWGVAQETEPTTGFIKDKGLDMVRVHCVGCHSSRLVIQNRGTESDWRDLIRWMQAKQGMWELPAEVEDEIVVYLAKNYGHKGFGRRKPLPQKKRTGSKEKPKNK